MPSDYWVFPYVCRMKSTMRLYAAERLDFCCLAFPCPQFDMTHIAFLGKLLVLTARPSVFKMRHVVNYFKHSPLFTSSFVWQKLKGNKGALKSKSLTLHLEGKIFLKFQKKGTRFFQCYNNTLHHGKECIYVYCSFNFKVLKYFKMHILRKS